MSCKFEVLVSRLYSEGNLVVNIKKIKCFCLGTIGLIVAPWKFEKFLF